MLGFWTPHASRIAAGFTAFTVALAVALTVATNGVVTGAADDSASGDKTAPSADNDAFSTGSSDEIVESINKRIRQSWTDNEIKPSAVADDAEWIRRVYLDLVGHIPPAEDVEKFLADKDKSKRTKVIDRLLEDPAYVRNFSTIWTNLTVGRQEPRGNRRSYSRSGIHKFFREAFARNRPWNEVVFDIVSGEGNFEERGEVNYLLSQMQMPDDAVQATAKTTRLFMGIQVQCTQCHDHPFNDWKQDQFWQFNSFFRQARANVVRKYNPETGRMETDYVELNNGNAPAEVFFEKRSGLMQVAYPEYFGEKIAPDSDVDRREALAKLMTTGDEPWIAKAMVNRLWGHFFGYGFTRPVDDMGPHNPASHPGLLDELTREFVKNRYDVKRLARWIANSEAYNLTSQFGRDNQIDNPAAGETPLFSHMYVKNMSPEQLYDSLIIATNAHKTGRASWANAEEQRQDWMQQFIVAFETDENDESTSFNGTIPQALMMMNSDLIRNAIDAKKGGFLYETVMGKGSDADKVAELFLATLSRKPTRTEMKAATDTFRRLPPDQKLVLYQDLFWALLNSNEFIFNH